MQVNKNISRSIKATEDKLRVIESKLKVLNNSHFKEGTALEGFKKKHTQDESKAHMLKLFTEATISIKETIKKVRSGDQG